MFNYTLQFVLSVLICALLYAIIYEVNKDRDSDFVFILGVITGIFIPFVSYLLFCLFCIVN